jgi:hypothetical protein
MNRKQRYALLNLLLQLAIWSIFAFSGLVIYLSGTMSTVYIIGCAGCLLWTSFLWFMPFIKTIRSRSKYLIDERDLMIIQRCAFIGYISIWFYFIAVSIILWFAAGPDGSVPIGTFPALLYVAMGIFSVVSNLAAYFFYREDTDITKGGPV